jgi:hypothetical protein
MGVVASVEQRNLWSVYHRAYYAQFRLKIELTGGESVPEQHGYANKFRVAGEAGTSNRRDEKGGTWIDKGQISSSSTEARTDVGMFVG